MNNYKNIENLIEKYYNGETSLQEEEQLQTFFLGEGVPDHLGDHKAWFSQLKLRSERKSINLTEDKLFSKLDKSLAEQNNKVIKIEPNRNTIQTWFYRVAAAVALILVGFYIGNQLRPQANVEDLRAELDEMKEMMLAQMTVSSASSRLQAVNYSFKLSASDKETLDALINVVNTDNNMNVRLKAVEALVRFGDEPKAKESLLHALGKEKEPAVQIALIDALVALKEKKAIDDLERIAQDGNSLKEVKDEAYFGLFKLKEM